MFWYHDVLNVQILIREILFKGKLFIQVNTPVSLVILDIQINSSDLLPTHARICAEQRNL